MSHQAETVENHFEVMHAVRGYEGTLARGEATCPLRIVLGRSNNGALTKQDFRFEADAQDILCLVKEYAPGGTAVEPALDDLISVEIEDATWTFEANIAQESEQVFTRDATGTMLRVHTKRIST